MEESQFLENLRAEVEAEQALANSGPPLDPTGIPPTEWLVDPTDIERERIGLRNLLGAIEALQRAHATKTQRSTEQPSPGI
jgi:hypothetical protein